MPAPLSIIIPTLNAASDLAETAAHLVPGVTAGLTKELVVSDGGSNDGTQDIARDLGATVVDGPPGRGGQIARGAEAAKAEWLLILHADTHLSPDWVEAVEQHIHTQKDYAGYFQLRFRAAGIWPSIVSQGANLRSRVFGLPYGDQGLLISQKVLEEVGGVPEVPLMEDVLLARRLKRRLRTLSATAATSASRYQQEGWSNRVFRNLWTLLQFRLGVSPETLKKKYQRDQSSAN